MATYRLQIVTAQEAVFDGQVDSVVLPGEDGLFGILAHHRPIVAVVDEGKATIRQGPRETTVELGRGFVEMSNNEATLLVDSVSGLKNLQGIIQHDDEE